MDDEEPNFPEPANMAWLLTFADLVSLMLTFFILLYSMKVIDAREWVALRGAFNNTFSLQDPIFDTRPQKTTTIEKIDLIQADNLQYIQNLLSTKFSDDPVLQAATLARDMEMDTLTISLPSKLLFAPGGANMQEAGMKTLGSLGDILRNLDNKIEVAGHTDPSPIATRQFPTNWELAMIRAIQVVYALESRGVVGAIPAYSYADTRFGDLSPHLDEVARYQLARRVDIVVHREKGR